MSARAWFEIGRAYEQIAYAKGYAQNRRPGYPMNAESDEDRAKRIRKDEDIIVEMRAYERALEAIDQAVQRVGQGRYS